MNKPVSFGVASLAVLSLLAMSAKDASTQVQGSLPSYVKLQSTTPGTVQVGHMNISGTLKLGAFETSAFLLSTGAAAGKALVSDGSGNGTWQTIPGLTLPYANTVNFAGTAFAIENSNTANSSSAIYGFTTGTGTSNAGVRGVALNSGNQAAGGMFETSSPNGYGVFGRANSSLGSNFGVYGTSVSTSGTGVYGLAAGNSGVTTGVYGQSTSSLGRGVFGDSPGTGVYGQTLNGIGVIGNAIQSGGTGTGVRGLTAGGGGKGVYGTASSAFGLCYGGYFESSSSQGYGVFGQATAASGTTYGGRFESDSTTGRGVFAYATASTGATYGGRFLSDSETGAGVSGEATSTVFGIKYGVQGLSAGAGGAGVNGESTNTSGSGYGGRFTCQSVSGYSVFTENQSSSPVAIGLYAKANGVAILASADVGTGVRGVSLATTGTTYGVYGSVSSNSGYGVYANGDLGSNGTKTFRIDHPFDPTNKYLVHYSSESPSPQNFYSGNVVTDSQGYAWVQLPDYFGEINKDFKYQLTVIDDTNSPDFIWAKVVKRIENNRFRVRSNKAGVTVSWRVEAERNDLYMRHKAPSDIVDKVGREKGTYQYPEFYGKPANLGMNYDPSRPESTSTVSRHP